MGKFVDLTGQKFGKLTVLGKGEDYICPGTKAKHHRWKVKCEKCEIEYELFKTHFLTVKNQSCNKHIHAYEDLTNKQFGKLTVIKKDEKYYIAPKSKKKSVRWICECDCDTIVSVIGDSLKAGTIAQCKKCQYKEKQLNGYMSSQRFHNMKRRAKKKNIYFDPKIDRKYLWNLFLKQNRKCALTNLPIHFAKTMKEETSHKGTTASLDRIDSSKGYTKNNIQWLHKDVNKMKWGINQREFIQLCKDIWEYNNEKN